MDDEGYLTAGPTAPAPDKVARHTVVIGETEVARLTCAILRSQGGEVHHLLHPSEAEVCDALSSKVDAVAVLIRGDVAALRYALLVEHFSPGVRLVATVFDRTLAEQLVRVVANCQITSPADVSLPSILGACLGDDLLAVMQTPAGSVALRDGDSGVQVTPYQRRHATLHDWSSKLTGLAHPYDDATRILSLGLFGLLVLLLASTVLATAVLHESAVRAFYLATRVVATVGPDGIGTATSTWYLIYSSISMLLTIALTAMFTAGVVNRILSARTIGLVGHRTVPRRDHVVVVGLGQVGLRLAVRLKSMGVPVVVVERDPLATNLRLARARGVPVLIAHGEDRAVLRRLRLARARALACMGSDELDNIEVSINALADAPDLRIVLRAGEDDVIAETRSLFRIGRVCDVSAMTAHAVTRSLADGSNQRAVYTRHHQVVALDGTVEVVAAVPARCTCAGS